jgi:hypothetical protein
VMDHGLFIGMTDREDAGTANGMHVYDAPR